MGGCSSSEANGPDLQRSREIDKMLKEVSPHVLQALYEERLMVGWETVIEGGQVATTRSRG
jgi:hypothetical protein